MSSRKQSGSWRSVGQNSLEIWIWNETYFGENVNSFEDIKEYINNRKPIPNVPDRFFVGYLLAGIDNFRFFKAQPMRLDSFICAVRETYMAEKVGVKVLRIDQLRRGLRGYLAAILFEFRHSGL